jgi:LAO/AO transport system kinase
MTALAEFAAEHGERGLRAAGGRRAAERALEETARDTDSPALAALLERRAGIVPGATAGAR